MKTKAQFICAGILLAAVTNLTGTLEFTDPNAANHLPRFYRTLLR
jgi:hypothetical protein